MPSALIIEDSSAWFQVVNNELLKLGVLADWADTPEKALLKLSKPQLTYDVVILDPHLDKDLGTLPGRMVARALSESSLPSKLILLSGYLGIAELEVAFGANPRFNSEYCFSKNAFDRNIDRFRDTLRDIVGRGSGSGSETLMRFAKALDDALKWSDGGYFEEEITRLCNTVPYLCVIARNMRTPLGEIDLLLRVAQTPNDLGLETGSLIVVECKNYREKIGVQPVTHLIAKAQEQCAKTALLFCRSGITGRSNWQDARGQIERAKHQFGIRIVVIDGKGIQAAAVEGSSFSELLAAKYLETITGHRS